MLKDMFSLQNVYASEEIKRGAINTSMLRVCFLLCKKRLLVASATYVFGILLGIISIYIFLVQVMSLSNQMWTIKDLRTSMNLVRESNLF